MRQTRCGQVSSSQYVARGTVPTSVTTSTAEHVLDHPYSSDELLASRCMVSLRFGTRLPARHRSQASEVVRACGFRVPAVLFTFSAVYDASLR